ncbi:ATP-grasp domain-containing protein [candidate division KSB1 bacterium]|nr:ATP-grasp domain-containing protein [candidate division KSB1 bacterium]RQW01985.1 MAG: ATP-grasp domain-containing protein [candidate division KSB1 bacterium]
MRHSPIAIAMSLDLHSAMQQLTSENPHFVFNLVESLNGMGRFIHFAPAVLDQLNLPYSGSSTHALYITTNKVESKKQLKSAGIPTPPWFSSESREERRHLPLPCIIKPIWEDASVGIDENSLVYQKDQLDDVLREKTIHHGECLVESYINGREFNLSLLAGADGPDVLPPAEMLFRHFPENKPHIVDYRAKWDEESFEYKNTIRTFDFPKSDLALLEQLRELALRCWFLFALRGYARVDFRVDKSGRPWVLEVNANPCISPDSGFVAASEKAGLTYGQVIERIMNDSMRVT